jgi:tetratricopeptide (TPR) repeat protein
MAKEDEHKHDQNVDIDIEDDVQGDIQIDRHDTHIDQSVSHISAAKDAYIATGKGKISIKKVFVQIIPVWVWIVIVVAIIGGIVGFWGYRYWTMKKLERERTLRIESKKKALEFGQGQVGILVANLKPPPGMTGDIENRGQDFAQELYYRLKMSIEPVGIQEVVVKRIDSEVKLYLESSEEAKNFGKTYKAKLVIWGDINTEGKIYPIIQSIQSEKERYDLRPTGSDDLDLVGYTIAAETVKEDVQRLVYFILGYIHYMQVKDRENVALAIEFFKEALTGAETNNEAYIHFYLGNAYYYSNRVQEAEEEYRKAQEEELKKAKRYLMEAYNNLGLIALNRNDVGEALTNFTVAYKNTCSKQVNVAMPENSLNPGCPHLIFNLASAYLENGEYKEAITYSHEFMETAARSSEEPDKNTLVKAYNHIAYAYTERAKQEGVPDFYETAKEYLNKVTEILAKESSSLAPYVVVSEKVRLNRNLGRVYLGLQNWDLALTYLQEAEKDEPDNLYIHLLLAQTYTGRCAKGDLEKALDEKRRYLKVMYLKGKLSEAEAELRKLQQNACNQ